MYERSVGAHYLTVAPPALDEVEAALALIAHVPGICDARVQFALACRNLVLTGDESQLEAYFAAADIGPEHEFDADLVAAGRQTVERMRMLEWELTGILPGDEDPGDEE